MVFTTINPLEDTDGVEIFDLQDIKIISKHYGYDFAECRVKLNNDLIGMMGYCLVENGSVIKNLEWRKDTHLLKKFYEYDKQKGFIEPNINFEEFFEKYQTE